jgi:hypothetical protein
LRRRQQPTRPFAPRATSFFGWPSSREVEAEVAAYFDAKTLDEEKMAVRRLNKAALGHVVYAPLGFVLLTIPHS